MTGYCTAGGHTRLRVERGPERRKEQLPRWPADEPTKARYPQLRRHSIDRRACPVPLSLREQAEKQSLLIRRDPTVPK